MEVRDRYYLYEINAMIDTFLEKNFTFEEICQKSEGVFPTLISEIIYNKKNKKIKDCTRHLIINDNLPEPHPIDYDWRFDEESAINLAEYCINKKNDILCVGTPSIFKHLMNMNCNVTLLDRNPHICDFYSKFSDNIINIDFMHFKQYSTSFNTIIMDPPWYPRVIQNWLLKSLKFTKEGSNIILPLIPKLVRPSAYYERTNLFNLVNEIGSFQKIPFKIYYRTPLFEQETLSYHNLPQLLKWRVCDFIDVKVNNSNFEGKIDYLNEYKWQRFIFGKQTIALRKLTDDNGKAIKLSAPYPDGSFILKSVSNDHNIRNEINFWTSRNKVLKVYGYKKVYSFLRKLEMGNDPRQIMFDFVNNNEERMALKLIMELIGV